MEGRARCGCRGGTQHPTLLPRVGFHPPHPVQHQHIFSDIFPVSTRGHRHDTDGDTRVSPSSSRPLPTTHSGTEERWSMSISQQSSLRRLGAGTSRFCSPGSPKHLLSQKEIPFSSKRRFSGPALLRGAAGRGAGSPQWVRRGTHHHPSHLL